MTISDAVAAIRAEGDRVRPIRVACVYRTALPHMAAMDGIRFIRMSEALARRGYQVEHSP